MTDPLYSKSMGWIIESRVSLPYLNYVTDYPKFRLINTILQLSNCGLILAYSFKISGSTYLMYVKYYAHASTLQTRVKSLMIVFVTI